jgi:hypothetical protein
MEFFTKIKSIEQIEELETKSINNSFKFFYSLFFKLNSSRDYLLRKNLSVFFVQGGIIHAGNLDNIPPDWQEMPYDEFVNTIST